MWCESYKLFATCIFRDVTDLPDNEEEYNDVKIG